MVGDLVAVVHDLLGQLRVVVHPVARQKEGDAQAALAQDLQDLGGRSAALGACIERERHNACGRIAMDHLGVVHVLAVGRS